MKKLFSLLVIVFWTSYQSMAQVGIGTEAPDASSILQLKSSDKGLLIPNVNLQSNTDNVTINSPANSLLVFNTSSLSGLTPGYYYWYSNQWNRLSNGNSGGSSNSGWSLTGNSVSSTDFLGTTNYENLVFKTFGNQVAKFVPNGGISLGNGASANDNQSIAIGVNANASLSNQAAAIGYGSVASGYQSIALGYSAESTQNSASALGFDATASGQNSTALGAYSVSSGQNSIASGRSSNASAENAAVFGNYASASGQNSTSIGYQATTSQANAIVLGNSSNLNNKVGIGTSTPDERLHVAGKVKIVDGTQANGYVLTSDANGVATWKAPDDANNIAYAQAYKSTNENLSSSNGITFGSLGESHLMNINSNFIQTQTKTGVYKITYTVSARKNSGSAVNPEFYLTLDNVEIPGTRTFMTIGNGDNATVTATKLVNISSTYQSIRIMSSFSDSTISVLAGGTSLLVEFVR